MNTDIKEAIKTNRIFNYEVAKELGISEPTFYRMLRTNTPERKREEIFGAIDKLKIRMAKGG